MTRETWDAVTIGNLTRRVAVLERQLSELQADPDGYTARLRRSKAAQERLDRIARERRSAASTASPYGEPDSSAVAIDLGAVTRDDVEKAVEAFKDAWHAADRRGERGNRVRAGLAAAAPFLGVELAELAAHAALADVEPCACRAHSGDNGTAGW